MHFAMLLFKVVWLCDNVFTLFFLAQLSTKQASNKTKDIDSSKRFIFCISFKYKKHVAFEYQINKMHGICI